MAEFALNFPGADKIKYKADAARYNAEKDEIKKAAEELDKLSHEWEDKSAEVLHQHHRWAQAMTALQIAISLAAITLLTRKKWMQYASYGIAGFGVLIAGLALMHI